MSQNSYLIKNKKWWNKKVDDSSVFTQPWLDLDVKALRRYANGKLKKAQKPINDIYPAEILNGVSGKKVLCLASGGGQQSAIFGLLGADTTVVDLSEKQLENDKLAANHYGYKVKTFQGDMCDLSFLSDKSFDLVYQPPSMGYISDVKRVYSEVSRILRKGGLYRADAQNPQSRFTHRSTWNGKGYLITEPYLTSKKQRDKDKEVIEFRHSLDDIFNGLIEKKFKILSVHEMPKDVYQEEQSEPGSWEHYLLYLPGMFTIVAKKSI